MRPDLRGRYGLRGQGGSGRGGGGGADSGAAENHIGRHENGGTTMAAGDRVFVLDRDAGLVAWGLVEAAGVPRVGISAATAAFLAGFF